MERLEPQDHPDSPVNQDCQAPKAVMAVQELLGPKVNRVTKEISACPDHQGHQEWTESMVTEVLLDQRERKENLANKESLDQEDPQELKDQKEILVPLVSPELPVNKDQLASKANLEVQERTEKKETEEFKETQAPQVNQGYKVLQEKWAVLDHQENKEIPDHLESKETLDHLGLPVYRERQVTKVPLALKDLPVSEEILARLERLVYLDLQENRESLEKLEKSDHPASREPEAGEDKKDTEEKWVTLV